MGPFTHSFLYNCYTPGKNAYAMSVLRRVEMKLDGQDIANKRCILLDTFSPMIILVFVDVEILYIKDLILCFWVVLSSEKLLLQIK